MCGVLYVKSTATIPLEQHLAAVAILQSRGPDFYRYQHSDRVFCAQTVLQITGSDEFYNRHSSDFFAFNGEIYNYRWFGSYSNDTELIYRTVKDAQFKKLTYFEGPWAWIYSDSDSVVYATDPQGERCLYRYQDNNILIVSSEVAAILTYINSAPVVTDYTTKHWPTWKTTPWAGIQRCEPGMLYNQNGAVSSIDSVFSWVQHSGIETVDQAWEEYEPLWNKVISDMTATQPVGCTFSGGLDSSVIAASLPADTSYYTTNMLGKDPVSQHCAELLSPQQQSQLTMINVTAEQWAQAFEQVSRRTLMPIQSWSFVGQWIVAQHCAQRILFTGAGADELFGGYGVYQKLNYTTDHSASPYSNFGQDADADRLWQQCLTAHQGQAEPATLLMDYVTQIGAVDLRGIDVCTMAHGIEPRSPFVHPKIVKFALSLPMTLRRGKPLIRHQFLKHWPHAVIEPKKGFTGHCNDSLPWMPFTVPDLPRDQQWQAMIKTGFTYFANQWLDQTTAQ
jgi:asparagine synthase (glutamine-hydrolysing)